MENFKNMHKFKILYRKDLTLYQNTKTYSLEKQNEIYKYSLHYFKKLSKYCTSNKFFGIRNRECVDLFDIPIDCDYITISQFHNITYNLTCWKNPEYRCYNDYYYVDSYNNNKGECKLLGQNEKTSDCINYAMCSYGDNPICARCKEDYYCFKNDLFSCQS